MGWFSRFFQRRSAPTVSRVQDFSGSLEDLPVLPTPPLIRVHVFADGRIELEGRPVPLGDLKAELKAAYRPNAVVYYSRENPYEDSETGLAVIACVCRLRLPIALPPEAAVAMNRANEKHGTPD